MESGVLFEDETNVNFLPDSLLLHIFFSLPAGDVTSAAQVCHRWKSVAEDERLWRSLVLHTWKIKGHHVLVSHRWKSEYRRLFDHTPVVLTETLTHHTDEVLHVSFSHDGSRFATTSKDSTVKVYDCGIQTTLKYSRNFRKTYNWDFTQFSSFNASDTMLLVSMVKIIELHVDNRGYITILSLIDGFRLLKIVSLDPSQLFGAWINGNTFLGGSLQVNLDQYITTINIKAFQIEEDENKLGDLDLPSLNSELKHADAGCSLVSDSDSSMDESDPFLVDYNNLVDTDLTDNVVGQTMFTFGSEKPTLMKFLTVAHKSQTLTQHCRMSPGSTTCHKTSSNQIGNHFCCAIVSKDEPSCSNSLDKRYSHSRDACSRLTKKEFLNSDRTCECVQACCEVSNVVQSSEITGCTDSLRTCQSVPKREETSHYVNHSLTDSESTLIYVTGEFVMCLHQIGFKVLSPHRNKIEQDSAQDNREGQMMINCSNLMMEMGEARTPDVSDHLIDVKGHITGLRVSKNQRYLYVNCRPWTGEVNLDDPWEPPQISGQMEVRVIDLHTMETLGQTYTGHRGLSPPTRCCFVFLDVSEQYVASGSEDSRGYLWDQTFGCVLSSFQHGPGVVNAVAFRPTDQQYLVTVSDDNTVKIWRSRQWHRNHVHAYVPSS